MAICNITQKHINGFWKKKPEMMQLVTSNNHRRMIYWHLMVYRHLIPNYWKMYWRDSFDFHEMLQIIQGTISWILTILGVTIWIQGFFFFFFRAALPTLLHVWLNRFMQLNRTWVEVCTLWVFVLLNSFAYTGTTILLAPCQLSTLQNSVNDQVITLRTMV